MPSISDKDIPAFVRRCYEAHKKANTKNREAYNTRLRAYVGDQWTDDEKKQREIDHRPVLVENRCRPAVNTVEGDIRLNPPGPKVLPVSGSNHPDSADPDVIEGLIREVEYRSHAQTAYATAGRLSAAGGEAVLELSTEFVSDKSFDQRLSIEECPDPTVWFWDPESRRSCREDAKWAGKIKKYSRDEYIARFGNRRVLGSGGWVRDAFRGFVSDNVGVNEWTGAGQGPFFVCEFYLVVEEERTLKLYTDGIAYFDDEEPPPGALPKPGEDFERKSMKRTIKKYLVDALDVLDKTDWIGRNIPAFPVLGPEIYIDGQLHRLSLISGAIDDNRALNYCITSLTEIAGNMPKSPWVGPEGTFDDPRWKDANRKVYAFLEYKPIIITTETGQQLAAPPPQRNMYEASVEWLIQLAEFFREGIKAVTSVYDPTLGEGQTADQSGKAISALQSQANVANFSYADNLHRAIELMYDEMTYVFPKIMDGAQVALIVRADDQHENVRINQVFKDGIDPKTGKKVKANNITYGQYSCRVMVGPSSPTRDKETLTLLTEAFKANPSLSQNATVFAQYIRVLGAGDPQMEAIADLIAPPTGGESTPAQMQQALQMANQKIQGLTQLVQQAHQALSSKLPELETKKLIAAMDNATRIRVAEVNASKDTDKAAADRLADILSQGHEQAHERGMQAEEHAHATQQAQFAADNQPEAEEA